MTITSLDLGKPVTIRTTDGLQDGVLCGVTVQESPHCDVRLPSGEVLLNVPSKDIILEAGDVATI